MSGSTTPAWVPPALTAPEASRVLRVPGRTLRRYLRAGVVAGTQFDTDYPWVIPTAEVERVAAVLYRVPDWCALANHADDANPHTAPDGDGE